MAWTAGPPNGGKWLCALVLGANAWTCANAQSASVEWRASVGVLHRTLTESSPDGGRLLTEKGYLPRIQLSAQMTLQNSGALSAEASFAQSRLDYEGQTQSAQPVSTSSAHREAELSLRWRPLAPAVWGEAWLGLGWLHARRAIEPSLLAGGLTETSSLALPGVRWRSPAWALPWGDGPVKLEAEAEWRTSARHRLSVDYMGLYDTSVLNGGRRNELGVRLALFKGEVKGEAWRWTVGWTRSEQRASPSATLFRDGVPVGGVHQPRLRIDDLSLSLTRQF
jgi:hypothetical protein